MTLCYNSIFDDPMFSIFTLAIKFDCVFLTIFQSFYLFVSFIFNKLAARLQFFLFSKDVLNHYLVHSSTFNDLKSAKNVVFFSFCILVGMPMGTFNDLKSAKNVVFFSFCILVGMPMGGPPPPPRPPATLLNKFKCATKL